MDFKNLDINTVNIKQKIKDDYLVFKIKKYDKSLENKIIINSNNNSILQFKINCVLIKRIELIYKEQKLEYKSIPYNGLFINCEVNNDIKLEINIYPLDLSTRIHIWDLKVIDNININNKILWDKIYIINLKRREDRKILMIEKLTEEKIDNYEIIEAYDGKDIKVFENFNLIKNHTKIINSGHFGCLLSHIKAIKKAKRNNYNNIMILEDDIIFNNNFLEEIKKIKLPNYDILYLGGLISEKKVFFNGWAKVSKVMGAYGYIINKNIYDKLLDKLQNLMYCVDVMYYKLTDEFNIYILNDLIKTNLDSSDTSKKKNKMINMINIINNI
jgi:GR25 family glycosyltransferase involved in LPS biosynthesis